LGAHVLHLIIADTETMPIREETMDTVLSVDAFQHLPDRPRAVRELARVMRPGTKLVLVEPGKLHESHPASVAVMRQHGILERGFDQADLAGDIEGTALGNNHGYGPIIMQLTLGAARPIL
jgi:ubiquinone/menaquinone biosynthesis C-methylase UbiE